MTVDQILSETRQWPQGQIDALVHALLSQPAPVNHCTPETPATISSLQDLRKKLDILWQGFDRSFSNEEIAAMIRESRGERE